jgi:hypothetical protein
MAYQHEVGRHFSNLLDQVLDGVIGRQVLAPLNLAAGPESGGNDLCRLPGPEFPAVADDERSRGNLPEERSDFLNILGASGS